MVGTGRARDAGGTPDRAATVRPRQEAKAPELVDSDPDEAMVVRDGAASGTTLPRQGVPRVPHRRLLQRAEGCDRRPDALGVPHPLLAAQGPTH